MELYVDGADLPAAIDMVEIYGATGATYNPTLLKKMKVTNYREFIEQVTYQLGNIALSFQVLSDYPSAVYSDAKSIVELSPNAYVKVPIVDRDGNSMINTIKRLTNEGIKVNVTSCFTLQHVRDAGTNGRTNGVPMIVSVFCGRIADSGISPFTIVRESCNIVKNLPDTKVLWAGARQSYDYVLAKDSGAHIITLPVDLIKKISLIGKSLDEYAKETVDMFCKDGEGYTL
jgi:transaldolase